MKSKAGAVILMVVCLVLMIGAVVWSHRDKHEQAANAIAAQKALENAKPVTCLIGSEKGDFFRDPRVQKILSDNGLPVQVQEAGSREIVLRSDFTGYDCAFPAGEPSAMALKARLKVPTVYTAFFTPVVIASWTALIKPLEAEGIVTKKDSTFYVSNLHKLFADVQAGRRWKDLPNNDAFAVGRAIYPSSTDPLKSNSGQMYLALASYVANGDRVVSSQADIDKVMPLVTELVTDQGYMENSSAGPFDDYATMGMGKAPLVVSYESLFIESALRNPAFMQDRVVLYPEPTVYVKHMLVPLTPRGAALGKLLSTDPKLRELAIEYGFRTDDTAAFDKTVISKMGFVPHEVLDVAEPPTFDVEEAMLKRIADARK